MPSAPVFLLLSGFEGAAESSPLSLLLLSFPFGLSPLALERLMLRAFCAEPRIPSRVKDDSLGDLDSRPEVGADGWVIGGDGRSKSEA